MNNFFTYGLVFTVIIIAVGYFILTQDDAPERQLTEGELQAIKNFEPENNLEGDEVNDPALAEAMSSFLASQSEFEASYEHVVPGEYSEIYVVRKGKPGEQLLTSLQGPGVLSDRDQIAIADEFGVAHFTWKINRYGTYEAHYDVTSMVDLSQEEQVTKTIVVE